jgi:hemerythrin-like domain-containing protein
MKRNIHLQPLSRQHHNGLMAVLLLKKGVKKKADVFVMKDFILDLWQNELMPHFSAEEKWLLPSLDCIDLMVKYEQMIKEHNELKFLIHQFKEQKYSIELVKIFYKKLELHIRFEERDLFPSIEKSLTNMELEIIGSHLNNNVTKSCFTFPVKFWE